MSTRGDREPSLAKSRRAYALLAVVTVFGPVAVLGVSPGRGDLEAGLRDRAPARFQVSTPALAREAPEEGASRGPLDLPTSIEEDGAARVLLTPHGPPMRSGSSPRSRSTSWWTARPFPPVPTRWSSGPDRPPPPVVAVETSRGGDEFVFRKVVTLGAPLKKAAGKPRLVFKEVGGLHFLEKVVPSSGKVQEVL